MLWEYAVVKKRSNGHKGRCTSADLGVKQEDIRVGSGGPVTNADGKHEVQEKWFSCLLVCLNEEGTHANVIDDAAKTLLKGTTTLR